MKTIFKSFYVFCILFALCGLVQVNASQEIHCKIERLKRSFKIKDGFIKFKDASESRSLASEIPQMKMRKIGHGLDRKFQFEGNTVQIKIANVDQFNQIDDYISIKTKKGHRILYPLNCKN